MFLLASGILAYDQFKDKRTNSQKLNKEKQNQVARQLLSYQKGERSKRKVRWPSIQLGQPSQGLGSCRLTQIHHIAIVIKDLMKCDS